MIKPINNHVLIEPLVHDSFIASQKETYEEIGVVVDWATDGSIPFTGGMTSTSGAMMEFGSLRKGMKVYFDSWLAAKYPKGEGEYYWLVKYEDIRAIEDAE
jgi:co-chaperonin GroES (HSP10)